MKSIKNILGIKTVYAIPSVNGIDITKDKKYKFSDNLFSNQGFIKDDSGVKLYINIKSCNHLNGGNWSLIIE